MSAQGSLYLPGLQTDHLRSSSLISGTKCQVNSVQVVLLILFLKLPPSLSFLISTYESLSCCRAPHIRPKQLGSLGTRPTSHLAVFQHRPAHFWNLLFNPITKSWDALFPFTAKPYQVLRESRCLPTGQDPLREAFSSNSDPPAAPRSGSNPHRRPRKTEPAKEKATPQVTRRGTGSGTEPGQAGRPPLLPAVAVAGRVHLPPPSRGRGLPAAASASRTAGAPHRDLAGRRHGVRLGPAL